MLTADCRLTYLRSCAANLPFLPVTDPGLEELHDLELPLLVQMDVRQLLAVLENLTGLALLALA